ncbi:MAG: glycosyltransferase family 87 protein [Candidatus Limnocylindria bacterium]
MKLTPRQHRLLRDAATVAGVVFIGFVWWLVTFGDYQHDARAYWAAGLDEPYLDALVGGSDAYLYSPVFAQLVYPLGQLPFEVFRGIWAVLNLGALVWLAGPRLGALMLIIPGSPVIDEVATGNVHLLIAAAIFAGLWRPAAWAFPLLTKITPGVGAAYLLGARRWRALGEAVGVTAILSLVSFAIVPDLWLEWVQVLTSSTAVSVPDEIAIIPGPLALRVALGGVLALAGGMLGWRWLVPVAATIALPIPWSSGLSVLVAIVALWRHGRLVERRHDEPDRPDVAA